MSSQSKHIYTPRKHFGPATCAEELSKLVADKFSVVNSAQIADEPVLAVSKTVVEKTEE